MKTILLPPWTMQAKTQTKSSQKIEKLKQSNKLNNNILIAKTLEVFTPKVKLDPFKYANFENMIKTHCNSWNWSSIISARPEKKFNGLWTTIISKKNWKNGINCKF